MDLGQGTGQMMIFVVGNSRSGTTMLGRVLGSHSAVHTFDELQVFERLIDTEEIVPGKVQSRERLVEIGARVMWTIREGLFAPLQDARYRADVAARIDAEEITDASTLYARLLQAETEAAGKSVPCEQTPRYLFAVREILAAFPEAKIVHIFRDPRDVLLSQKNRWRRGFLATKRMPLIWILRSWSNYHPYLTARLWMSAMAQADSLKELPQVFELRYEALLEDPEPQLRLLCDHLNLPFEPRMLEVRQIGSSTRADRQTDAPSDRGFDRSRIGTWQRGGLSAAEIAICESVAGDAMEARGYARSNTRASALARWLSKLALLPKGAAALALNITRFRNLSKVVMRRL